MFEELHLCPWALVRHFNAPFAEERAHYLSYCAERGDSQATLASKANRLIYVARQLSKCRNLDVAIERLGAVACGEKGRALVWIQKLNKRWSQKKFLTVSRPWLRFLGWWRQPLVRQPFQEQLDEYCHWIRDLRGLTEGTIDTERRYVTQFLRWYAVKGTSAPKLRSRHLGEAVDKVRRREHKLLKAEGDERLTGTKYDWLPKSRLHGGTTTARICRTTTRRVEDSARLGVEGDRHGALRVRL